MAATGWPIFGLLHLAQAGEQTTGELVDLFVKEQLFFFMGTMGTGEGAGVAPLRFRNRVESHATSGVSPRSTFGGMAMLKSLMLLATQRLVASLSPGEVCCEIPHPWF